MRTDPGNNRDFTGPLRDSKDYPFDREGVKNRLLLSIAASPRPEPAFSFRWLAPVSVALVSLALLSGVSIAFSSASGTMPGDKLYFLSRFQERLVLALPMPEEKKTDLIFGYAYKHLSEVSQVTNRSKEVQIKTLRESQEFMRQAIDDTMDTEQKLRKEGKTDKAESLNQNLEDFQAMAEDHVRKVEELKRQNKQQDEDLKKTIEEHVAEIKNARQKARQELKDDPKKDVMEREQKRERD